MAKCFVVMWSTALVVLCNISIVSKSLIGFYFGMVITMHTCECRKSLFKNSLTKPVTVASAAVGLHGKAFVFSSHA